MRNLFPTTLECFNIFNLLFTKLEEEIHDWKRKVDEIMSKYNHNFSTIQKNASVKDLKAVFKLVADESNRKQHELIGLDKEK